MGFPTLVTETSQILAQFHQLDHRSIERLQVTVPLMKLVISS